MDWSWVLDKLCLLGIGLLLILIFIIIIQRMILGLLETFKKQKQDFMPKISLGQALGYGVYEIMKQVGPELGKAIVSKLKGKK